MKKLMIAAILCMAIAAVTTGVFAGCTGTEQEVIITGSTSVDPVMKVLAEKFEEKNQDITISITASGSSQGIADAIKGACDIGMASRALKDSEKESLKETVMCTDGIALIVNKNVALSDVTSEQVYNLYASGTAIGSITLPLNRSNGSGTRDGFNELIKNSAGQSLKEIKELKGENIESTGAVMTRVQGAENVIGYISLGSVNDTIKTVALDGVAPTVENIKSGSYKLQRPFVLATSSTKKLSDAAQKFIDFIMSEEGQKIIEAEGYIAA